MSHPSLTEQELLILKLWDTLIRVKSVLWPQFTWLDTESNKVVMPPWLKAVYRAMEEEYDKVADIKRKGIYG